MEEKRVEEIETNYFDVDGDGKILIGTKKIREVLNWHNNNIIS